METSSDDEDYQPNGDGADVDMDEADEEGPGADADGQSEAADTEAGTAQRQPKAEAQTQAEVHRLQASQRAPWEAYAKHNTASVHNHSGSAGPAAAGLSLSSPSTGGRLKKKARAETDAASALEGLEDGRQAVSHINLNDKRTSALFSLVQPWLSTIARHELQAGCYLKRGDSSICMCG